MAKKFWVSLSITKQIALLLALFLFGPLVSVGFFYTFLSRMKIDTGLLNIASRQGLLANQLYDHAYLVHLGQEEDREDLRERVDEFDQGLGIMEEGGQPAGGEALFSSREGEAELARMRQLWSEYKVSLLLIAAGPVGAPQAERAYAFIESTTPLLIEAAEQLVAAFIKVNSRLEQQVFLFLNAVVGLDVLLLLAGIWTIRNYIVERRQAEAALWESEARLRAVVDGAYDSFIAMDAEGRIVEWNPQAAATFGWSREETLGRSVAELIISPQYREAHQRGFGHFLATGEGSVLNKPIEIPALRREGREFPAELTITPIRQGESYIFSAFLRDITERKQVEENLRVSLALQWVRNEILQMQSEEGWKRLVEVVQGQLQSMVQCNACNINLVDLQKKTSVVYYLDREGRWIINRLGLPPTFKQALKTGRYVYRRNQTEMAQYEDPQDLFRLGIRSTIDVPFLSGTLAMNSTEENAFTERDILILEQFAQVMSEAHRRLVDLKALEEKETQLRQAQRLEAIGQLAGGVAHDFNNLLTVVSGYSEVLQRRLDPQDPGGEYLQEIQKATDRGAALARQLLAFSRRQVLQPEVLNLNALVADLGKMLQRLLGEDIELHLTLDPGLEAVKADWGQLEQVLVNLVVNARDAMPQGGRLRIETRNIELASGHTHQQVAAQPGPYVLLTVSDTGVGMDAATQEHIFEPFFTTKEQGKGTGLGLATVYGIVKQSGGYIWVGSEVGKGTTFEIYLPRTAEAVYQADSHKEADWVSLRGRETVLLVEDEVAVRRLIALTLRAQGYTVLEAGCGEEAMQVANQHAEAIQLLVTDVMMPGMNGRQLAEQLCALQPEMKVVYMSGYTEGIIEQQGALESGVVFLQKPFNRETLTLKVREVLDNAG